MARTSGVLEPTDERGPRPTRTTREPASLSPAMRVRRAVTLLVLTVIAPGAAQYAAGNRRVGKVALKAWGVLLAFAAFGGLLAVIARPVLLALVTSPPALVFLSLVLFAGALAWPALLVDAWRLCRPHLLPRRPRILVALLAVVLVLVTGVPLVGAGRRALAAADFIGGVFGSDQVRQASRGRFNVLLMGGDAGPDRVGTRPDSMTLVSIDAQTGRAVLFSLPRNLENVFFAPGSTAARAMPRGWDCGDKCLLNALYTWGQQNRSLYPGVADPGAAAMKDAVSGITGLEVNYYVLIDLSGFRNLIDAMGGIDLTVRQRVPIGGGTSRVSGYIEPGHQHLDGYHALWFARSRHGANDYERMARQRCVMDAMLHQLAPETVLAKFEGIAAAGKDVMSTDIPSAQLDTFLTLAGRAKTQKISSVQFVPPLIDPARPDFRLIRSKVSAAIEASRSAPTADSGSAGRPASSGSASAAAPSSSGAPVAEASDITAVCSAG